VIGAGTTASIGSAIEFAAIGSLLA
jgi:hypothetical protein